MQPASTLPIDWDAILKKPEKMTPTTTRRYLSDVVERMNCFFGLWMDGPDICRLRVTRTCRTGKSIATSMSCCRARQLFPRKVDCRWRERGKNHTFFKNVVDLFLMAGNRKEVYQRTIQPSLQQSSVLKWLKMQLELPGCQFKWGGLNARHDLYASFLEGKTNREDYNPKRISQLFYQALPECRPSAGKRIRQRGVAMIYLPVREHCQQVLDQFEKNGSDSNEK